MTDRPEAATTARTWTLHVEGDWTGICEKGAYCEECFQEKAHGKPTERVPVVEQAALTSMTYAHDKVLEMLELTTDKLAAETQRAAEAEARVRILLKRLEKL